MCKLLIATNESNVCNNIKEYALSAGFDVTETRDGMNAIRMCETSKFDIIIMDTILPKLDGFSVCKEIRKAQNTPIIFISSSTSESDKILGFEVGADDFMAKPFSVKVLMARINAIILRQTGRRDMV